MADEEEFAGLTDRIATAVTQTQASLQTLANDLGGQEIGRMLNQRLEDVGSLKPGVAGVRAAEAAVDGARGAAVEPAKQNLRSTYGSYQVEARNLSSRIGATERALDSQRETLNQRAGSLKGALKDLARIEQLPDRATADVAKLRAGVQYLSEVVGVVDERVEQAMNGLANGRRSANEFERSTPRIDGAPQHSAEIGAAVGKIEGSISQTRGQLNDLRAVLDERSTGFRDVAQFAVDVSNTADAERQQATAGGSELANAMRAGVNPTSRTDQHPVANQAESDLGHRINGPVQEGGLNR